MDEAPPKRPENAKLIKLIDFWSAANESRWTYKKVCHELFYGNTYLYFESSEVPAPLESFGANDPTMSMPFYNIEGDSWFCAFTSAELFGAFAAENAPDKEVICVKMAARFLLEAIDKSPMAGLIINTHSENVFVVYREGER